LIALSSLRLPEREMKAVGGAILEKAGLWTPPMAACPPRACHRLAIKPGRLEQNRQVHL